MKRHIMIAFILLSGVFKNSFAQVHVQTTTLFQTTTSKTISLAFGSSSTSGNLIVVHLDWDKQGPSVLAVTDNKGNSYSRISGPTNWDVNNYSAELWYAYNITGGGAPIKVTAQLSAKPASFFQIYISEYSGIISIADPLDKSSVATGSTPAVSSGNATTTYNNELIYGASIGASGTLSTGGGFTNRSTANSNIIEDKKGVATGSYSTNFISAGGNWIAQMATFVTTNSLITLPLRLISFTGKCNDNKIDLEWTTTSEMNNNYFTIERSADGTKWQAVGTVMSAGNSSAVQKYSFTADEATGAVSYFRLKQTDLDGRFNYFDILPVNNCNGQSTGVNIYPNPSNGISLYGKINLKANETYSIEIFDNLGNIVNQSSTDQQAFTVEFPHVLPSGIYYARFTSANFSMVKRFLVQH